MAFLDFRPKPLSLPIKEWPLILGTLGLCGIGLALIFSATSHMGEPGKAFVMRQITWCCLGIILASIFLLFDYEIIDRWAFWLYAGTVFALLVVWAVGKVTLGSRRWIDLGLLRLQPSEFAKLAVIFVLAKCFQGRSGKGDPRPLDMVQPLALAAAPVFLVLIQPDLGTAAVIGLIALSMILFSGIGRRLLLWAAGILALLIPILLLVGDKLLMEYQRRRIATFLNPDFDPLGAGYHIIQSQIAIGSGGTWGKGFLKGTQNQLMFLPVNHTDFVFSILAEEWGFVACTVVLALFALVLLRGIGVVGKARDDFGAMLVFGCTALLFWHVVINVGMVTGLLPVVGVPLSFLSYGGSSLLVSFLAVAVIVNVSMRRFSY